MLSKQEFKCDHRHDGFSHPLCYQRYAQSEPLKVGYFDIETSNLRPDFGWVISWCIKHAGENRFEEYVLGEKDYHGNCRDKESIQKLVAALGNFDKIVTYYGTKFDNKFVRTRALIHKLQFIPNNTLQHLDLYYCVKARLLLSRSRLANVGSALGLPTEKTPIEPEIWNTVGLTYDRKALEYIREHNRKDTMVLEQAHKVLQPYISEGRKWF